MPLSRHPWCAAASNGLFDVSSNGGTLYRVRALRPAWGPGDAVGDGSGLQVVEAGTRFKVQLRMFRVEDQQTPRLALRSREESACEQRHELPLLHATRPRLRLGPRARLPGYRSGLANSSYQSCFEVGCCRADTELSGVEMCSISASGGGPQARNVLERFVS